MVPEAIMAGLMLSMRCRASERHGLRSMVGSLGALKGCVVTFLNW